MKVPKGTWVQIRQIVLKPEERAPQVPNDTKKVPLELRVKGFLEEDASIGDEVTITTLIGRKLKGRLEAVNPRYEHDFGEPIPELLTIGQKLRQFLFEEE
ncbi:2-amino-4-ketopentanoate thiolase [Anoxybacter fermentans]|uniref:2-amino-4-ketopentanoate thiolase n=1 Tax=Anoxybacter fermentans TaxID=1323375 RepID=A0A3Q9HSM2_9FIRM|nr:2-amino-4-oxopentanoate thiolase subunit OrtA [Anoxybacter fermentans]AZR74327.1 2-amino-4-ketopentanoate thiolase [Anoxybacter fermentans]